MKKSYKATHWQSSVSRIQSLPKSLPPRERQYRNPSFMCNNPSGRDRRLWNLRWQSTPVKARHVLTHHCSPWLIFFCRYHCCPFSCKGTGLKWRGLSSLHRTVTAVCRSKPPLPPHGCAVSDRGLKHGSAHGVLNPSPITGIDGSVDLYVDLRTHEEAVRKHTAAEWMDDMVVFK